MIQRCHWVGNFAPMIEYHDKEWGVPCHDDRLLWEYIVLDTFQAGLSWRTMIAKRENFRKAFDGFDVEKNAWMTSEKMQALMNDPGIIRNRLKIAATLNNARAFLKVVEEKGSFASFLWDFVDGRPILNQWERPEDIPVRTELSDKISRELRQRGFQFTGSTMVYAFLQGAGLVNDHLVKCFRYHEIISTYGQ
ncbi:MAG: DNA-3-methyladenine glycosylase I [Bacteroidales bacterium]|nr:DNA-3-methyladenine glycosylase I [Bacteroidales bacterium]NPV35330.1 DNA-3-methyladenine glycosylase I [Bacteroidales bacterium]